MSPKDSDFNIEPLEPRVLLSGDNPLQNLQEQVPQITEIVDQMETFQSGSADLIPVQELYDPSQVLTGIFDNLQSGNIEDFDDFESAVEGQNPAASDVDQVDVTLISETEDRLEFDLKLESAFAEDVLVSLPSQLKTDLGLNLDEDLLVKGSFTMTLRVISEADGGLQIDTSASEIYFAFHVDENDGDTPAGLTLSGTAKFNFADNGDDLITIPELTGAPGSSPFDPSIVSEGQLLIEYPAGSQGVDTFTIDWSKDDNGQTLGSLRQLVYTQTGGGDVTVTGGALTGGGTGIRIEDGSGALLAESEAADEVVIRGADGEDDSLTVDYGTASLNAGKIRFESGSGNDTLEIISGGTPLTLDSDSGSIRLSEGTTEVLSDSVDSVTVSGQDGQDDSLTIDYGNGLNVGQVHFNGGTGNDALEIIGERFETTEYTAGSSTVQLTDDEGDDSQVSFSGLAQPLSVRGKRGRFVYTPGGSGSDDIQLEADGDRLEISNDKGGGLIQDLTLSGYEEVIVDAGANDAGSDADTVDSRQRP